MSQEKISVGVLMGSRSDLAVMRSAERVLSDLGISHELRIMSAHRTPDVVDAYVESAPERGIQVLICAAGMAAHLAGAVAGRTLLPVIGVPLNASLDGMDALLATVQMPPGVPVATVTVGKAGAKNAAWLAARILSLGDAGVRSRLELAVQQMAEKVRAADAELSAETL